MQRRRTRIGRRAAAIGTAALLLTSGAAYGVDLLIDTEGHTTLEQLLVPTGAGAFKDLTLQPGGEPYVVRDGDQNEAGTPIPDAIQAQPGRDQRRISLAYVSQMTDFQLADEESPARVEFLDVNFNDPEGCPPQFCGPFPNSGPASAHRPQEALTGFQIDATIRQLNALVPASPVTDGEGNRRSMDFSLATGDQADNNQRNETEWVRDILEGNGPISFNSGSANPLDYDDPEELLLPGCAAYAAPLMGEGLPGVVSLSDAPKYTGVQDYDDYDESQTPLYYDPDDPRDLYAAWPTYTGLMDRAQQIEIDPEGLDVPSYVTNGNHDVLTQGNEDANNEFERIATGCLKVLASTAEGVPPDPNVLLAPASAAITVPRDPLRRAVSKPQIKAIYGANDQDDDHGFEFVDPAEEVASRPVADAGTGPGAASYYAWDPPETPGFRFISIDTNSEGGQTAEGVASGSSNGNIDDPQFQWLKDELEAAEDRDQLVVVFGHHPVRSMSTEIRDEQAPQCLPPKHDHGDNPEHYAHPGCDHDPRPSEPIHLGQDPQAGDPRESFVELLNLHPNVVGYIAGHTHEHRLLPFARTDGSVWWEINTAAVLDWNTQSRLIEVMDNRDGTLSIFGTAIDHASDPTAPPEGSAAGFDGNQLASIGRTLAFNDPQGGPGGGGAGRGVFDRNAEMLVGDPREADLKVLKADNPDPVTAGQPLTYTITVTNQDPPGDVSGAQGVTLTDDLPTTAEFVSAVPSPPGAICNSPAAGEDLVCSLGDLPAGASATVTVTVTPQTAGTITNTATVASLFDDPDLGNNTDSEDTTVDPDPAVNADVELVSKTGSPSPVTAGDPLTYAISVRNNGDDAAPGVAVTDALPGGVVLSSATTPQGTCETDLGVVTCTMGTLADGETGSVQIVVVPQVPGTLTNTATVSSGATDPIPGNNSAQANTQVLARPSGAAPAQEGRSVPPAREGRCRGRDATIVGTSADETITGTKGADVIDAGDGNDTVLGRKRKDVICGRRGDDKLFGGRGRDKLIGGPGNDRLLGGRGRDRANGKGGKDFCRSAKPNSCRSKR